MFKQEKRQSINKEMYGVINDGLELMKKPYFGDSMFLVWLDYSRKMLDCGYDKSVLKNLTPNKKLNENIEKFWQFFLFTSIL